MNRLARLLLLSTLACAAIAPAAWGGARDGVLDEAPADAVGMSPARLARLDAYMARQVGEGGYVGGVTLVARHGRIVDWRAHGHRDLARTQPLRRDDIFRIYSMTKPIASVAVLMLMEEGALSLEDPLSRYLPAFAGLQVLEATSAPGTDGDVATGAALRAPARPVTLRMLLTHTAGFAAGLPGDAAATAALERADPWSAPDLAGYAARVATAPLAADPGTRFGYDGTATELLARVVEVVSGQPFDAFLRQRILQPLGMRDTGFEVPPGQRHRVVDITTTAEGGALVRDDGPSSRVPGARLRPYDSAAGGLYSTAADYARFCQMLLDGGRLDGADLLGRQTVALMFANHLTMLDPPVTQFSAYEGFGLGGYVVRDVAGRGVPGSVGTFGWAGAASTSFSIDPVEGVVALLLLQHLPTGAPGDLPRIGRPFGALVQQALVAPPVPAPMHAPAPGAAR